MPEGLTSLEPIIDAAAKEGVVKPTSGQPVLSVSGVSRKFNAVVALEDVGFEIQPGEIHAIVGPNGSGKTTMLNAISGLISLESGTIRIGGVDVTSKSASRRARMGLGRTFQQPRILDSLSAWENVDLGPTPSSSASKAWLDRVLSGFRAGWDSIAAGTLPHGQRRSLEVIRAMRAEPSLLALDEPAAGLSHAERDQFGRLLRQISESTGAAILMVEHDLELVWGTADRITVLDRGRVVVTGVPAVVRAHPDVAKLFVGVGNAEG
jgi:branched-chain amino acid transport system permease protein